MRALPDALAAAAADAGVEFRYDAAVSELERSGRPGDRGAHRHRRALPCRRGDPDDRAARHLPAARTHPAPADANCVRPPLPSWRTSAAERREPTADRSHHTILFGDAWDRTFDEIIDEGRAMADPSLLVTRPTAGDPTLAPSGRDLLYVLAPAPNIDCRTQGLGHRVQRAYTDHMLGTVRSPAAAPRRGRRAPACHHARRTGRARAWSRAPRSRSRTPSARPARSGQATRARHRQRGTGRIIHGARRRHPDRHRVRPPRRRPGHRSRNPDRARALSR